MRFLIIILLVTNLFAKDSYEDGWMVKIYSSPEDLATIPDSEVARFINKSSPYNLIDHKKINELSFLKSKSSYLYEGYFNADEGEHHFIVNMIIPHLSKTDITQINCRYYLNIGDREVINQKITHKKMRERFENSIIGSIKLREGSYKAKQWISCDQYFPVETSLRIKRPNMNIPRLANNKDFVHKIITSELKNNNGL